MNDILKEFTMYVHIIGKRQLTEWESDRYHTLFAIVQAASFDTDE